METPMETEGTNGLEIAIVGMACRFPGAADLERYWHNLREGVESITFLEEEELERSAVDSTPADTPGYVKAAAILEGADLFDAAFFGVTPKEAEVMDPQQRVFLECAWEALEHAGYDPERHRGGIGVYAGARTNTYLFNLFSNPAAVGSLGAFELGLGNDLAFLTTRVSHRLNLRGPACSVHTACSTSLVAVHLACQALLANECKLALAGGIAINVPQRVGYLYQPGSILSPDGHCRAFDAKAQGTIFGSGVGVVVLKRLEDALADGDTIHAVVKGTAINNDGSAKASFTAPSVQGQAKVIRDALAAAEVEPRSVTYIEAHGTGTALGDPIEVRALTKAFRSGTEESGFCALGSVKTNVGHLDAAAGAASLIKAVLALQHRELPPTLHFEQPNPQIDFASTPFFVNTRLRPWEPGATPRRAGVSSFGIGGTNAHVILEEAPPAPAPAPGQGWELLVLSAKTATALRALSARLADHLERHPEQSLADVAYTLQAGRQAFTWRRAVLCQGREEAVRLLRSAGGDSDTAVLCARPRETLPEAAARCESLGRRWLAGEEVDWSSLHSGQRRRRVPLPTYPFERHRYWIGPGEGAQAGAQAPQGPSGKRADVADWFHVPTWRRTALPALHREALAGRRCWLVLTDSLGLGEALATRLEQHGQDVVRVAAGTALRRTAERRYELDPSQAGQYVSLLEQLATQGLRPSVLAHLWSLTGPGPGDSTPEAFRRLQAQGYYSLLYLGQALARVLPEQVVRLEVISDRLHDLEGSAALPEKAPLLGPCKVLPQEREALTCRCTEVALSGEVGPVAEQLLAELSTAPTHLVVAWRGSRRYLQAWEPVRLEGGEPPLPLRPQGVYLLTGGLGGVGLLLAEHLASTLRARLVLVGRTPLPARAEWEAWLATHGEGDKVSRQIRRVRALEEKGAQVLVLTADVAQPAQLRAALERAEQHFGPVHGVLHAAGITHGSSLYLPFTDVGPAESETQFGPKVYGTYALEEALRGRSPDFVLLFSSNAAVLGGLGYLTYAAANLFLDAFASSRRTRGTTRWLSASWDPWPEETRHYAARTSMDRYTMTVEESAECFRRLATQGLDGHVAIVTGDLEQRLGVWINRGAAPRAQAASSGRARRAQGAYVPPSTELERQVAELWQEVIGVERVGLHDDFFELGGHSLLATRVVGRLRALLGVEVPLSKLFEVSTVAGLARVLSELKAEQERQEQAHMQELLEKVASMSEEELERELARRAEES